MITETTKELLELIRKAKKVLFLTGAGISAPSGLPVYQGDDGSDARDAELAYRAVNDELLAKIKTAEPNQAHKFIAELSQFKEVFVATQNIDCLHQKGGLDPKRVFEIHGSLEAGVVMFGQQLPWEPWHYACGAVTSCDLVIVVGTSLSVNPFAELANDAVRFGKTVVVINKNPSPADGYGSYVIHADCTEILTDELLCALKTMNQ